MVSTVRAAVWLTLMVTLCHLGGSDIQPKMNQTIQSLLQHYKIDDEELYDGNHIFPKEPPAGKMETKLLFMGGILDTYEKLFGHMLRQLPTASPQTATVDSTASDDRAGAGGDIRRDLKYILSKVQELKKKSFHEQEMILRGLQDLKHVQMDNLVVQGKALWELPWLYEEASSLSDNCERQRCAYIRPKMNQTIQSLLQHYEIDVEERFDGKNVFPREPPAGKMETKLLFMGGILDTYEKLFGHMLRQLPTASPQTATVDSTASDDGAGAGGDIRKDLKYILSKVQELKKKSFHEQEMILRGLQDLKHVQMDNLVVQSKALWELPWLYEEASSLSDNSERQQFVLAEATTMSFLGH